MIKGGHCCSQRAQFSEQGQLEEVGAGYTFLWSGHPKTERRDAGVTIATLNDVLVLSVPPQSSGGNNRTTIPERSPEVIRIFVSFDTVPDKICQYFHLHKSGVETKAPIECIEYKVHRARSIFAHPLLPGFEDATIVHLYKRKGNRQLCDNPRGISLLNIAWKIFARILFNRLNGYLEQGLLPESQCGFRRHRGTTDMIFTTRQLQEKCQEMRTHLYTTF
ncbi:unnamed protein product [Schistocephalus solidus]|uniref:Reverse transcriptase domain-containing protein n=1 Tax=Schistocephalus solidus TaxID=70667 RepID=A0A183SLM0_SCHSO|nr:unnamed protein product [Schistocephalus solidus]